MIGGFLLALAAATGGPVDGRHAVLIHKDARFESISGAGLDVPCAPTVHHAWVWSVVSPPRRVLPADLGRVPQAETELLRVTVLHRSDAKPGPADIIAAPVSMWQEVPEPLLPRFPAGKDGKVAFPRSGAEPWRVRAIGKGCSSNWVDVEAGRTAVDLVLIPTTDLSVSATAVGGPLPSRLTFLRVFQSPRAVPGKPEVLALFEPTGPRKFQVPGFPAGGSDYLLVFSAPDVAPLIARVAKGGGPLSINLERGAELRGVLVDSRGRPLAGAGVGARCLLSPELPVSFPRQTPALNDGSWHLSGLPPGRAALLFVANGMAAQRRDLQLAVGELDLGTIKLQPAIQVPVRVLDDTGSPVGGAEASAGPGHAKGITDPKGLVTLSDLGSSEAVSLVVKAPGCRPKQQLISPPFGAEVVVEVKRALTVNGRAVDQDGTPVADVQGRVETGNSTESFEAASGRFTVQVEPGKAGRLLLRSPSSEELAVEFPAGQPGENRELGDIRLRRGLALTGRVLNSDDGEPVPGARVWALRPSKGGALTSWMLQDLLQNLTRKDGTFSISGATPGPLTIHVDAPRFARFEVDATVDAGRGADVGDIRLSRGATVNVRVSPEREGEEMARIDLKGQWHAFDMLTAPVNDSLAAIENVPAGHYTLSVVQGAKLICQAKVNVPENRNTVSATCSTVGPHVSGRVFLGKSPAGPGMLYWTSEGNLVDTDAIMTTVLAGDLRQQQVLTGRRPDVTSAVGADGSFETDELAAGLWRVSFMESWGSPPTPPQSVNVPDAETFEITLSYPGRSLSGVVVDEEDHVVAEANVRESEAGGFARSDETGRFSMTGLSVGVHHLQASTFDSCSDVVTAEIPEGTEAGPVKLVISGQNEKTLVVQVVGAEGQPASGAFVFLDQPGGGLMATADGNGRAELRLTKPFPSLIRCAAFAGGAWSLGGWVALDDVQEGGLTLGIGRTGGIVIRSNKSAGIPSVLSPNGWNVAGLLARLGVGVMLRPGGAMTIGGLPEASYTLAIGGWSNTVSVRAAEDTVVDAP